jgi:RNA polymerase sigma factor (sigma-70 family)
MRLAELTDARLVARCRTGEHAAWCELVERYSRYVHSIATRVYRLSPTDAEDVFQEVFARTYQHLDRLRDDAAIRPWLAQLTRRLAVDRIREGARIELVGDEPPDGADDAIAELDEAMTVHDALGRLPEHCREILDRFFARDESYQAIGAALDLPSGTIASRISRCLAKLRDDLGGRSGPASPSGG